MPYLMLNHPCIPDKPSSLMMDYVVLSVSVGELIFYLGVFVFMLISEMGLQISTLLLT